MLSPIPLSAVIEADRVQFAKKGDDKRISSFTKKFLQDLARSAGVMLLYVTSTTRTAQEQANAMYDKVKQGQFDSYKPPGAAVQDVAATGLKAGFDRETIVKNMLTEIDKVGFINVSQHAGVFGVNVVDIAPSMMTSGEIARFISAVRKRFGAPVYKFGHPTGPKPGNYPAPCSGAISLIPCWDESHRS